MVALVITRGGWGDVIRFDEKRGLPGRPGAELHPVCQDGDAFIFAESDITRQYTRFEWVRLIKFAGLEDQLKMDNITTLPQKDAELAKTNTAGKIYEALLAMAIDPPDNRDGVFAMVANNRLAQMEKKTMSVETTADTAPAAPAAPRGPRLKDINPDSTIHFGVDKEGKPWSHEHCPYRPDSNRSKRWANLVEGMKASEAIKTGNVSKALHDMRERGFIVIKNPDGTVDPHVPAPEPVAENPAATPASDANAAQVTNSDVDVAQVTNSDATQGAQPAA